MNVTPKHGTLYIMGAILVVLAAFPQSVTEQGGVIISLTRINGKVFSEIFHIEGYYFLVMELHVRAFWQFGVLLKPYLYVLLVHNHA